MRAIPLSSWIRRVRKYQEDPGTGDLIFVSIDVDDDGNETAEECTLEDIECKTPGSYAALDAETKEPVCVCTIGASGERIMTGRRSSGMGGSNVSLEAAAARAVGLVSTQFSDLVTLQAQSLKEKDKRIRELEKERDSFREQWQTALMEQEDGPEAELIQTAARVAEAYLTKDAKTKFKDIAVRIVTRAHSEGIITPDQIRKLEPIVNEEMDNMATTFAAPKQLDG